MIFETNVKFFVLHVTEFKQNSISTGLTARPRPCTRWAGPKKIRPVRTSSWYPIEL